MCKTSKEGDIMLWDEKIIVGLEHGKTYTHREIVDMLKCEKPDMAYNTYHWAIHRLINLGLLEHKGYDSYSLKEETDFQEYHPSYSEQSTDLIQDISLKYPHVRFTVFETVLMNDFLNHLIAQNTIFLQVEKESSIFMFRYLQDNGYQNIMYKPDKEDYQLYWSRDGIIVTDMISEAPIRSNNPHAIMLEKMLVDMRADKLINSTYSQAEFPYAIEQAKHHYKLDETRLLRYARRRNRENEMKMYLERSTSKYATA